MEKTDLEKKNREFWMHMMKKNRKNVRKTSGIILALLLSVSLAACGSGTAQSGSAAGSPAGESARKEESAAAGGSAQAGGTQGGAETAAEEIEIPEIPYVRDDGGVSLNVFAMDTYMTLLAYGDRAEEAVLAAAAEIHRLDDMLSTGNADSEISVLNAAGSGEVSDVVMELVERSAWLYKETGGLFDIAIYPVMKLWGFPTQEYRIPDREELEAALKLTDASAILTGEAAAPAGTAAAKTAAAKPDDKDNKENKENKENKGEEAAENGTGAAAAAEEEPAASASTEKGATSEAAAETSETQQSASPQIRFGIEGMEIDLGGIAKGYTSSRVMEIYKEYGVKHGLVSLGGNVQALGTKEDGKPWRVAIQNPQTDADYLGILDIDDKCVITSGGYERYFVEDGVRYHHIIDPRTGYPADSGLISSTIISKDGTLADGLSTSLFIMGKDEAEKYWRAHPGTFDYVLEDADGTLYVTEDAAKILTTDAKTVVIRKKK